MSAPRTVVSGGTGYVGRFIVERLLDEGHEVTVTGRTKPARDFFSRPVTFVADQLEPDEDHAETFAGADFFVHCAFDHLPGKYRGGEGNNPEGFRRRNVDASLRRFEAAKKVGAKRVVFLSSRAVYGDEANGAELTEETEARPDTLYGEVKLAAERGLGQLADECFSGISLRVTGVYGPPPPGRAHKWAALVSDHLAGRKLPSRIGTEVHGEDVAWAVLTTLTAKLDRPHEVFCVSDIVVDSADIAAIVNSVTGVARPLPERADPVSLSPMNCAKLKSLGWRPGGRQLFEASVRDLANTLNGPG
ncbi:MAG: NAD(P)-dependent oxidoreductase [Rhizobiaceae bacterium]|nr:NAD(P)-dependent oxidoreductase [Rhizobiaceae bacterium]